MGDFVDDELPLPSFHDVFGDGTSAQILSNNSLAATSSKKRSGGRRSGSRGGGSAGDESTGRWTPDEQRRFLEGLMLYGKDWKKMAPLIKTRTLVQIRTHAQKVFKKMGFKNDSNKGRTTKKRPREDEQSVASILGSHPENERNMLSMMSSSDIRMQLNAVGNISGEDEEVDDGDDDMDVLNESSRAQIQIMMDAQDAEDDMTSRGQTNLYQQQQQQQQQHLMHSSYNPQQQSQQAMPQTHSLVHMSYGQQHQHQQQQLHNQLLHQQVQHQQVQHHQLAQQPQPMSLPPSLSYMPVQQSQTHSLPVSLSMPANPEQHAALAQMYQQQLPYHQRQHPY